MEPNRLSTGSRIAKYGMHYLIVIPPLLWLLFAKLVPFINEVLAAFVHFELSRGLWGSPWAGLDNFRALFADLAFRDALLNTIAMKVGYLLLSGLVALALALALSAIGSRPIRRLFQTLFLLPYFVPTLVLAYVAAAILSPEQQALFPVRILVLADADRFQPVIVLLETVKTCGIPLLLALAAIEFHQAARTRRGLAEDLRPAQRIGPAARAIVAYMLLQAATLLSVDFEMLYYLSNPLVQKTGITLDIYGFRSGFQMMNISVAGAASLLQFAVQLLLAFLAYAAVRGLFMTDLFGEANARDDWREETIAADASAPAAPASVPHGGNTAGAALGIATAAVYAIIVLSILYVLFVRPFLVGEQSEMRLGDIISGNNWVAYFILHVVMTAFGMIMTLLLAYPLTVRDLPGRGLYKALLITLMGMGNLSLSQYLVVNHLGLVNTIFSQIWAGLFTIAGVFVLKSWFNSRYGSLKEELSAAGQGEGWLFVSLFIPKVWKPLLAIGILQFVALWGSYYASLIYINTPDRFSPLLRFMQLAVGSQASDIAPGDPVIMRFAALIALPPIILLLVFRKWLTAETLLSQIRKG